MRATTIAKIFIDAAALVDASILYNVKNGWDDNSYACLAIRQACIDNGYPSCGNPRDTAAAYFRTLYSPFEGRGRGAEFWNNNATLERRNLRVLALLFAAHSFANE